MDNMTAPDVPYIAHEADMARMERANFRLTVALVAAIVVLLVSNLAWLYAWMQYDYVSDTYTATQDGGGVNIIGGGDVAYGPEDNVQAQDEDPKGR